VNLDKSAHIMICTRLFPDGTAYRASYSLMLSERFACSPASGISRDVASTDMERMVL
jgi:hypothetical protein